VQADVVADVGAIGQDDGGAIDDHAVGEGGGAGAVLLVDGGCAWCAGGEDAVAVDGEDAHRVVEGEVGGDVAGFDVHQELDDSEGDELAHDVVVDAVDGVSPAE